MHPLSQLQPSPEELHLLPPLSLRPLWDESSPQAQVYREHLLQKEPNSLSCLYFLVLCCVVYVPIAFLSGTAVGRHLK